MQGDKTEKLFFMIELLDRVSGPSKGVNAAIRTMQSNFRNAAMDIATGGTSIYSGFAFLEKASRAAREFEIATGEVKSLSVLPDELEKLQIASKDFVAQFGGNATDIVRAGYDIQSAIPGLTEGALAAFTTSSALLAKATKSDVADMTNYMGTMYNIFEKDAQKIGQAEWVDQLTGKTATAVKMFKTTGAAMNAAFGNLGSTATETGIALEEQMAVLGTLQATMGGSNAGTAYKGFITKLDAGQKALGLSFKDAQGNMLPIYEILDKIRGKIGSLDKDKQIATLSQAFGETGAMAVVNMLGKTDQLRSSIDDLSKISGSTPAVDMAQAMTDQMDRFSGAWENIKISLGTAVLPTFNDILSAVSGLAGWLSRMMDQFVVVRWGIATAIYVIAGLAIALGSLKLIIGVTNLFKSFWYTIRLIKIGCRRYHVMTKLITAAQWLWGLAVKGTTLALNSNFAMNLKVCSAIAWQRLILMKSAVAQGILTTATWFAGTSFGAATIAAWGFTVALLACPITWIVIGVMALIGAVVALIVYWDDLNAWIEKITGGAFGLVDVLLFILGPIGWVIFAFKNWDKIVEIVKSVWDYISKFFDAVALGASYLGKALEWLWGGSENTIDVNAVRSEQPVVAEATSARRGSNSDVKAGGFRSTTNNTTNWGGVTINTTTFPGPGELEDWVAMRA